MQQAQPLPDKLSPRHALCIFVDAPPGIAQMRELAVDALPGIAQVRELAGIDDTLTVVYPRPGACAPAAANPVASAPTP